MKTLTYLSLVIIPALLLTIVSCSSTAPKHATPNADEFYLNVTNNAPEKEWMYALAVQLHGKTEQPIKMGRVDVLTQTDAIEIDWLHKWHESIGQALHYAIETHKQPTIALISLTTNDIPKINYIHSVCDKLKIRMIILLPKNQTNIR